MKAEEGETMTSIAKASVFQRCFAAAFTGIYLLFLVGIFLSPAVGESPEALNPDWGPQSVSTRYAPTAHLVHSFVTGISYNSGRYPEGEKALLAQGRTRAQQDLRGLLRELPDTDRFRFMVAFTMYWLGFDVSASREVMLEYCPPQKKPGYAEDTLAFLNYAYQERPDPILLKGMFAWSPKSDGASGEILGRLVPAIAREHPRDFVTVMQDRSNLLWGWTINLLLVKDKSPEQAYPGLVAIAENAGDPLRKSAHDLLRNLVSNWPAPPDFPPGTSGRLLLLPEPVLVEGQWYVPVYPFINWLGARGDLSYERSSLKVSWRGQSRTWTQQNGLFVKKGLTPYLSIMDFGKQFEVPVSLRPDGEVIDFGTPGEKLYAVIPVGWQMPPYGPVFGSDEWALKMLLSRPYGGNLICQPYDIKIADQWAAAKIHPLNTVADDALVLLDRRWGAWRIIALGTDLPARGRNFGIPVEVRKQLGLTF